MGHVLVISKEDNVANALDDLKQGEEVVLTGERDGEKIKAADDIKFGFKMAIAPIARGGDIKKYGQIIGKASRDINPGECVHIHNVEGTRGRGDKKGE